MKEIEIDTDILLIEEDHPMDDNSELLDTLKGSLSEEEFSILTEAKDEEEIASTLQEVGRALSTEVEDTIKEVISKLRKLLLSKKKKVDTTQYGSPDATQATEQDTFAYIPKQLTEVSGEAKTFKILETGDLKKQGTEWQAVCIKPGLSLNKTFYAGNVLQKALPLFEGASCFADHRNEEGGRSIKDLVGWFDNTRFLEKEGIVADFHALESREWFTDALREVYERGSPNLIGFSINGEGLRRLGNVEGKPAYIVEEINRIDSVDAVIAPSAGGRIIKLLAGKEEDKLMSELEDLTLEELRAAKPNLIAELTKEIEAKATEGKAADQPSTDYAKSDETVPAAKKVKAAKAVKEEEEEEVEEQKKDKAKSASGAACAPVSAGVKEQVEKTVAELEEYKRQYGDLLKEASISRCRVVLSETLGESQLPDAVKAKVKKQFDGREFTQETLQEAIKDEEEVYSKVFDERPQSYIKAGDSQKDRSIKALDGFFSGQAVDGVKPARTLKEAYAMWKGIPYSYDMDPWQILAESASGGYASGSRLLESIASSTWAQVLGDSVTRRMLADYALLPFDEWRKIVSSVVPVQDFRTQRRMRLGGYAAPLTSVAEAALYSALVSPGDEEQTYAITKRGGYETLTLEAIANDDVGAIRLIPKRLASAAKITLYEFVMDFLRLGDTSTVVMGYDSEYLFATAHGNYSTTADAVTLSDANLSAAKRKMRDQTAYGQTGGFIGLKPSFLVVPNELEPTAIRLRDNEFTYHGGTPGTSALSVSDVNVHRNSFELLVVDYWTDSNNWFLVADPRMVPTIEIGFWQGKEEPEIFVQDMPNVGSLFDSDQVKYKIRHIYGGSPLDHRAFYMSNVT
jgi:hypothetical protein